MQVTVVVPACMRARVCVCVCVQCASVRARVRSSLCVCVRVCACLHVCVFESARVCVRACFPQSQSKLEIRTSRSVASSLLVESRNKYLQPSVHPTEKGPHLRTAVALSSHSMSTSVKCVKNLWLCQVWSWDRGMGHRRGLRPRISRSRHEQQEQTTTLNYRFKDGFTVLSRALVQSPAGASCCKRQRQKAIHERRKAKGEKAKQTKSKGNC